MSERVLMFEQDGECYAIPEEALAQFRVADEGREHFREQSVSGHQIIWTSPTSTRGTTPAWGGTRPNPFTSK